MKVTSETALRGFDFWSGAKDFAAKLTCTELDTVESILEDIYPEGLTDTNINDYFWFEDELICDWLGLDIDEVWAR